jgi:predicted RNase H-like HicB family nuclease
MNNPYSILIQWSNEDQKYIASLPEFGPDARTHRKTHEEALAFATSSRTFNKKGTAQ